MEEKADKCLELAHSSSSGVIDYRANLQEYEKILADVLNLQNEATKVYDEICNFRLENEIKTEADNLKNNIDGIVEKIKAMENEINESASPA
ncbi:hypothetical protein J6T66_03680 [bacterium]|nr:hypothetical protein [bacterium]